MKMTKAERTEELDAVKMVASEVLNSMPSCTTGFNYGYLWAYADIGERTIKFLVGGACPVSWHDCEIELTKKVREITGTFVNMD